ncbi:hypothetical protein N9B82_01160 [Saprospiraceae bacterium]|nr:hypothetical protein [Saprospiraceae bacterium]
MKNILKIIFFLTIVQIMGYFTLGNYLIGPRLIKDVQQGMKLTDNDSLIFCLEHHAQTSLMDKALTNRFKDSIDFTKIVDLPEWQKQRTNPNYYAIAFADTLSYNFMADITSYCGTLYYGEEWKSRYLWLFFTWIKINQHCSGQS